MVRFTNVLVSAAEAFETVKPCREQQTPAVNDVGTVLPAVVQSTVASFRPNSQNSPDAPILGLGGVLSIRVFNSLLSRFPSNYVTHNNVNLLFCHHQ